MSSKFTDRTQPVLLANALVMKPRQVFRGFNLLKGFQSSRVFRVLGLPHRKLNHIADKPLEGVLSNVPRLASI